MLIAQGCAYKNYFEKDIPAPENAPVIDGKWEPMPREVLDIALTIADLPELTEKLYECIGVGKQKEIEASEVEGRKNADATPE